MFWKNKHVANKDEIIDSILTRGVEDIIEKDELKAQLESGKTLRVKLGFDPTSPNVHIGRAVVLRKLKQFQDLGHKVVFIVGNFTAQIGDPSDKLEKRPMLTEKDVETNLASYKDQVGKILDMSKVEFVYNADWLSKLTMKEIAELAESFTVQQMLSRRNFRDRYEKGEEISLREFMYPIMQGYDSVQVKSDVELGGFDQLFNVKAGRVIQRHYGMEPQTILTTQMLEGTDGRKMSSSWGNVIALTDEPNDMYGKIMALRDELISKYFLLCTDLSESEIKKIVSGDNPKDAKMRLAREIVALYHSEEDAQKAEDGFVSTFSNKEIPEDIEEIKAGKGDQLGNVLVDAGIVSSKSEFRRLVESGAIRDMETDEKIENPLQEIEESLTLKVGKKRFVKIVL